MELFVYSDESGVFDPVHNDFYVYGGYIFLGKDEKDDAVRMYTAKEKDIRNNYDRGVELKANLLSRKDKHRLHKRMDGFIRFGAIISEKRIESHIHSNKKSKQRYLDYVYKLSLKHALKRMDALGLCEFSDIERIHIFVDEHTTATDGIYELRESLLQEFKHGTHNWNWTKFFQPIIPDLVSIDLQYCSSEKVTLIRAADIFANYLFAKARNGEVFQSDERTFIKHFP